MKYSFLRCVLIAAFTAVIIAASGCGKEPVAIDPNIPDNTVPPLVQTEASADGTAPAAPATSVSEDTQADTTAATEEVFTDETTVGQTDAPVTETVPDTRATEYLKLLNSDSVHAAYLEISSIDGENMFSTRREYFVNGSDRIYINDDYKTLIQNGTVTYIDPEAGIYYSYPYEGEYGLEFGYELPLYRLVSSSEEDGALTEVYSIEGYGLTSTWKFESDGTVKVSDRYDSGSFTLYTFETVDGETGGMDFSIPEGFTEVDAEEYINY